MALNGEELLRQKQFEQEQYARPTLEQLKIARLEQQLQHAQNSVAYYDEQLNHSQRTINHLNNWVDKLTNQRDLVNGAIALYNTGKRSEGITLDTIRGGDGMNFEEMRQKSDEHTQKLVEKQNALDVANFDPQKDAEHLPYEEENLLFEQVGNRIRWKSRGERYYARRFFPNEDCAQQTMDVLKELRK